MVGVLRALGYFLGGCFERVPGIFPCFCDLHSASFLIRGNDTDRVSLRQLFRMLSLSVSLSVPLSLSPDMTFKVDWASKTNN